MSAYHPLGMGQPFGAHQRYWIRSKAERILGALLFAAPAKALADRDNWIGWTPFERRRFLCRIVGNSRFLILPGVQVPHLASHVLALAVRRLRTDWIARYGYAPVLLETYVMPPHGGTCYRAANWRLIGETASIGRGYRKEKASQKMIFVYPLTRDWRRELCAPAPIINENDVIQCREWLSTVLWEIMVRANAQLEIFRIKNWGGKDMPEINLMVFCPSQMMRQALGNLFQAAGIFNVLTETGDFDELLAAGKNLQPEILLWACSYKENAAGNMIIFKKNCPLTSLIYLADSTDNEELAKLPEILRAEVDGCLSMRMLPRDLIKTMEIIILVKYTCLSAFFKSQLVNLLVKINENEKTKDPPGEKEKLTPREKEILQLLAQNYSNPEIAARLLISEATVKTHVSRILTKLKSKSRSQAVAAALNKGIIDRL